MHHARGVFSPETDVGKARGELDDPVKRHALNLIGTGVEDTDNLFAFPVFSGPANLLKVVMNQHFQ